MHCQHTSSGGGFLFPYDDPQGIPRSSAPVGWMVAGRHAHEEVIMRASILRAAVVVVGLTAAAPHHLSAEAQPTEEDVRPGRMQVHADLPPGCRMTYALPPLHCGIDRDPGPVGGPSPEPTQPVADEGAPATRKDPPPDASGMSAVRPGPRPTSTAVRGEDVPSTSGSASSAETEPPSPPESSTTQAQPSMGVDDQRNSADGKAALRIDDATREGSMVLGIIAASIVGLALGARGQRTPP